MKYVLLTIIFFLLSSINSCSKKETTEKPEQEAPLQQEAPLPQEAPLQQEAYDFELRFVLDTGIYQINRDFTMFWLSHENVYMYRRVGDILVCHYSTQNKYLLYDYIQKSYYELPLHDIYEIIFISPREIVLKGNNYNFKSVNTDITMNITFNDYDRKNNTIGQNIMEAKTENEKIYYGGGQSNDYSDKYFVEIFGKKALFNLSNIPGGDYTHLRVEYDPLHDVYTVSADRNGRLE